MSLILPAVRTVLGLALLSGCAEADPPPPKHFEAPANPHGGSGAGGAAPDISGTGDGSGDPAGAGGRTCGGERHEAAVLPLGLVFMVDKSLSMSSVIAGAGSATKWEAVASAVSGFLEGAVGDELQASVQYFPYHHPGVPAACSRASDCNGFGPCSAVKVCTNDQSVRCESADDCVRNGGPGQCLPGGRCASSRNKVCIPEFGACGDGSDCLPSRVCAGRQSCDAEDYEVPAVKMEPRATVASKIRASLESQVAEGATPTGPALAGALSYASAWGQVDGTRNVAVVLVTDGLPTDCEPLGLNEIAGLAEAQAQSVSTYVIGVFEPELAEQARVNLDALAFAGGTETAFIVSVSGNVGQDVGAALSEVRKSGIGCEFRIPEPTEGALRFDEVNVEHARSGQSEAPLPYFESAAECGETTDGWHYDVSPQEGTPAFIVLCSATCARLQDHQDASVSVVLGCPTVIR